MDDADWNITPQTLHLKEKARYQLGTSGSGNHFCEFGTVSLPTPAMGLPPGSYLSLLSHSGSRGAGASVAQYYATLARELRPELPPALRHLSWLDVDDGGGAGEEYYRAMGLMGKYSEANHEVIHDAVVAFLGCRVLTSIENHHNYCWEEVHDGREVFVHRKGATPAGRGMLGVIPGSMTSDSFIVRGLGNVDSLESAAHGAGRVMSRTKAKKEFRWKSVRRELRESGVILLSAGLDEAPGVYKDIEEVMNCQKDLVEAVARFEPKIVKMAPAGEPPED